MGAKNKKMLLIVEGPGIMAIEHSVFDQETNNSKRKQPEFLVYEKGQLTPHFLNRFVITAAIRKNPMDPAGTEWILWGTNGAAKFIADYSTKFRKGRLKWVDEFPSFDLEEIEK